MNAFDKLTTDEVIRLFCNGITSLEEHTGLTFHEYDHYHAWTDKNGKERRGIFVFLRGDTPRLYTADFIAAHYKL
jgi:uncharacterized protein (DUF2126 family)